MTTLIGVSGSLRKGSFNSAMLRAAQERVPAGVRLDIGSILGIPLYNADLEVSDGIPGAVTALKDAIASADGLLIATPEYNNSIPGVFKNAIDWLSRPADDIPRVFGGKPVAIMGASPGGFGTVLSQNAWLPVVRTLGMRPWFGGRMMLSRAHSYFDEKDQLVDQATLQQLSKFVAGFAAFCAEPGPAEGSPGN